MFAFSSIENIWDISFPNIPQMNSFENEVHPQFERPAQIQINMEQQVHLSSQVVFSLKPGILSIIFENNNLTIYFIGENIMYCSTLGSKTLLVAKVDEVISDTEAKVQIYEKKLAGNKFMYFLPPQNTFVTINRKLVHKVGVQFTKGGNLKKRVVNQLSSYKF